MYGPDAGPSERAVIRDGGLDETRFFQTLLLRSPAFPVSDPYTLESNHHDIHLEPCSVVITNLYCDRWRRYLTHKTSHPSSCASSSKDQGRSGRASESTQGLCFWLIHCPRYDMRKQCQEILPGVLLGPLQVSKSLETLQSLGVTHKYAALYRMCPIVLISYIPTESAYATLRRLSLYDRASRRALYIWCSTCKTVKSRTSSDCSLSAFLSVLRHAHYTTEP